jgi:small GTP-binding protein
MARKKGSIHPGDTGQDEIPPGFKLRHTLRGHEGWIGRIAWSPDGRTLASGSRDTTIRLWDTETGKGIRTLEGHTNEVFSVAWAPDRRTLASGSVDQTIRLWDAETRKGIRTLEGHTKPVLSVAWSPDGRTLASGSGDNTIRLWDAETGKGIRTLGGHTDAVFSVAWAPDGRTLASGSLDNTIRLWDAEIGQGIRTLEGHTDFVDSVAWSPDGRTLASGSVDQTIRLWDAETGRQTNVLEGHTSFLHSVSFSLEGRLLASKANDNSVRLWRCDTWEMIANLPEPSLQGEWRPGLAFHPTTLVLATLGEGETVIRIWDLDLAVLLRDKPSRQSGHYTNAKVVLVGNTSVGKTGLGLVLVGRKFRATESTHGRHVWMFESGEVPQDGGQTNTRETLLWDLAGQPGYRLIHRLHLHEVAVALVLFDSRSETDPFAGVAYWARALDEATRGFPLVKFLVASRIDRGGPAVSQDRIEEIVKRYGFDGFFQTSAKRGDGIEGLRGAIRRAIAWDRLPNVSTTDLFKAIKTFLMGQKKQGCIVATEADLFDQLRKSRNRAGAPPDVFTTCLGRLESAGLVRRLSFGDHVLLQPEMLDDYCGWLALAARDQPDGLGFIKEDDAQQGQFNMDARRRLAGKSQEKTVLLATVQEVVGRNIAHRQETARGMMLVFPSELNAELPDYPGGYSLAVAFRYEGPVGAIYATLAVTLVNSIAFEKKWLYKNAALYEGPRHQVCGFAVEYPDRTNDALGRLTVFFEVDTQKDVRLLFLRYVNQQLERLAFQGSVQRERIYHCGEDDYTIPQQVVEKRIKLRETTVVCPVCLRHFLIDDLAEQSAVPDARVDALDASAVEERERQERLVVLREREQNNEFHVFLCHNSKDKPIVRELAQKLRDQGVLPWIDEQGILAGDRFAPLLETTIEAVGVVAVIIGPQGLGRWQEMEYHTALQRYIEDRDDAGRRRVRVVPVLLPGVPREPQLPAFLRGFDFIDLRKQGPDDRDQIRKLVAAILGDRPRF